MLRFKILPYTLCSIALTSCSLSLFKGSEVSSITSSSSLKLASQPTSIVLPTDEGHWWELFGDPQLNQLIEEVKQKNLSLEQVVNILSRSCQALQEKLQKSGEYSASLYDQLQSFLAELKAFQKECLQARALEPTIQVEPLRQQFSFLIHSCSIAMTYFQYRADLKICSSMAKDQKIWQHLAMLSQNGLQALCGKSIALTSHEVNFEPKIFHTLSYDTISNRADLTLHRTLAKAMGPEESVPYPHFQLMALTGLETLRLSHLFSLKNKSGRLQPLFTRPLFKSSSKNNDPIAMAQYDTQVTLYQERALQAAHEIQGLQQRYQKLEAMDIKEHSLMEQLQIFNAKVQLQVLLIKAHGGFFSPQSHG